ncbi:MAG: radical SAM protein [Sulfurospirillaceae bacterium]|nr:radical SAM protein [Sulfurospirillaceae bacterium]
MNHIIFGPVTSRRFGQSLGIDLSPNKKQCNFDCLYCELKGAKTVDNAKNTPTYTEVLEALSEALKRHHSIDVITLTANGEPTLYPELESLINGIQALNTGIKLLILSNGSTISNTHIQSILMHVDIVKLSLDCATPICFKKLDRPHNTLSLDAIIEGMKTFRQRFNKSLILEILVVEGLNDTYEEFEALNAILQTIQPDRIDVGTIDRPPAYSVKGVSLQRLIELADVLKDLHVNIAYKKDYPPLQHHFNEKEILGLFERRPQSFDDIKFSFSDESQKILSKLVIEKKVCIKNVAGVDFYVKEK